MVDVNADGKLDVAAATDPGTVIMMLGTGDGGFGAKASYPIGTVGHSLGFGDVNGDGGVDFVTADYLGSRIRVLLSSCQ